MRNNTGKIQVFSKLRERYYEWNSSSMEEKNFESFGIVDGNGKLTNAEQEGRYFCFPAKALQFISMGSGRDIVLHGSVCMQMQCSVGIIHMPESLAIFTMFIS